MLDIICLGELLIDFVTTDKDTNLMNSSGFIKAPGGAPANVAVGASRLGKKTGFIGKVGNDPFGYYLKNVLDNEKVNTDYLIFDEYYRTTLSFVGHKSSGERDCMFFRNPGADMLLDEKEIKEEYFKNAKIFHFGSISLNSEVSYKATLKAIEYAKNNGLIISYDPNLRLSLCNDEKEARAKILEGFTYADFVKISDEEMEFITGFNNPKQAANFILELGAKLVTVTLGEYGVYYTDSISEGSFCGNKVNCIETTGAGDAFTAFMLNGIVDRFNNENTLLIDEQLISVIKNANIAGALATTKTGAIPSLPTQAEIDDYLFIL